jgi:hypothetical protein
LLRGLTIEMKWLRIEPQGKLAITS